jgi:cyclophilin family peptidyl-prolyl cis-trans isomerase
MQVKVFKAIAFFVLVSLSAYSQSTFVELKTSKGTIVVMLYDKTPMHKQMFINEIKKGTYQKALFNRVIKDFVSQAGELDDSILNREKRNPQKTPLRLPAEINGEFIHKNGALGAGRDDNPEKSSYFNQIYLVSGKVLNDEQLDKLEEKTGKKMSSKTREIYKTQGGVPRLDNDYTIFGEIVEGQSVADQINKVETNNKDVPMKAVVFDAKVVTKWKVKVRNK